MKNKLMKPFIFSIICIIVLLGVIWGQYDHNKKINKSYIKFKKNSLESQWREIKIINLEHEEEVKQLKLIINRLKKDIKESIKYIYQSQVNTATSYSNRVCETDSTPNITASNEYVTDFTIAVSRDLYDQGWTFGKLVYIEELGVFARIQDLMNERFCKRIDIFNANTKEAISFGKKQLTAYLLDDIIIDG